MMTHKETPRAEIDRLKARIKELERTNVVFQQYRLLVRNSIDNDADEAIMIKAKKNADAVIGLCDFD